MGEDRLSREALRDLLLKRAGDIHDVSESMGQVSSTDLQDLARSWSPELPGFESLCPIHCHRRLSAPMACRTLVAALRTTRRFSVQLQVR